MIADEQFTLYRGHFYLNLPATFLEISRFGWDYDRKDLSRILLNQL